MGNVESMMASAHQLLVGRGYDPELPSTSWRRLAYVMTEATLEAYESMAVRQTGGVVSASQDHVLPSQFEVQNAPKAPVLPRDPVTWEGLYDIWVNECVRRNNTRSSYLAAMTLFRSFCGKSPTAVNREDVLAFRDFLFEMGTLASGTISNKIGFVGTLVNSGRNNATYAKYLPHNSFEKIVVKRSKRGLSGHKRLPFSDTELKILFASPIYARGKRPKGGGGEAAAWIPAIAYLTGMRLEEIALLHVRQFHVDARGNHYIHTEDGKNENSADRDVPIHPALLEAGLLDYVATCSGRLFPKVTCTNEVQSKAYSQWWGRYLITLGTHQRREALHWSDQYRLDHLQHPREHGGGRTWTWSLTDHRFGLLAASMDRYAAGHGRQGERTDDLDALVEVILRMPVYYGVRQQQLELLRQGQRLWGRSHPVSVMYPWPQNVPYLDKRFVCYHQPEPLRLDVLVARVLRQKHELDDLTLG